MQDGSEDAKGGASEGEAAGDKDPNAHFAIGLVPMLGIGFHSFIDGVIYSVTFTVSIFTGLMTATGMVLHEFPEGIVTYLLLLRGGFSKQRSLLLAFIAAALTTPACIVPVHKLN